MKLTNQMKAKRMRQIQRMQKLQSKQKTTEPPLNYEEELKRHQDIQERAKIEDDKIIGNWKTKEPKKEQPYLNDYHKKNMKECIEEVKIMQEQPFSRKQCIEQSNKLKAESGNLFMENKGMSSPSQEQIRINQFEEVTFRKSMESIAEMKKTPMNYEEELARHKRMSKEAEELEARMKKTESEKVFEYTTRTQVPFLKEAWKEAHEIAALAVEEGDNITKATLKAIVNFKNSKFYNNLSENSKKAWMLNLADSIDRCAIENPKQQITREQELKAIKNIAKILEKLALKELELEEQEYHLKQNEKEEIKKKDILD